jgi:GntR family transcriptional repressor for pyruvate dehydrogenase complex
MSDTSQKLSSQIAKQLLNEIISGHYKPGMFLPSERELQEDYDASRPIIRESLQILAAQGLVAASSRKGTVVNPDINQPVLQALLLACVRSNVFLEDILSVRSVLEPQIASIAAGEASSPQIRDLLGLAAQFEAFDFEHRNLALWRKLDTRFHLLVAQATQNQVFAILVEVLIGILTSQRRGEIEASVTPDSLRTAAQQHHAIAEAIANGDSQQAGEVMRIHLETTIGNTLAFKSERVKLGE